MKSVVVMGKGSLACDIAADLWARSSFKVEAVVPSMPEPGWAQSLSDWARIHEVPVVESGDYVDLITRDGAYSWPYDLIVSVFYSEIVSPYFLQYCRRRETEVVNLHNAPLPKYRGVNPVNWALKNGEDEHGVTIHRMVPDVDAGPIYGQVRFSIYPETDEVIDVYQRCLRYGKVLAAETLTRLDEIIPVKQNHEEATYYSVEDRPFLNEREDFLRPDSDKRLVDYPVGDL